YDTDLIWQNALRTMNLADLMKNLHLDYILPQNIGTALPTDRRIALVMHLYYEESFENNLAYIASMPSTCDVILTVASKAKAMRIRDYCDRHYQNYHIDIRIVENRGRAISALLVAAGKDLLDYDYVCCLEDRKRDMLSPQDVGYGSHSKGFDNTIATKEYVENVIHLFENSPRLGIAMPTPPNHAWYLPNFVYGWAGDLDGAKKLIHETLGLNPLPLDNAKEIIAPLNGAMWFRPQALKPLLGHEWKYEDFPEEPLKPDGTINHAIVRSCAYIAQAEGYFPAYILSDRSARTEITNLAFEDRELIRAISDTWLSYDIEDTKKNIIRGKRLGNTLLRCTRNLVSRIPLIGPSLYHLDWGV
ncbi:rhamnan synthesis F family protein, partial [Bifidobacterium sp. ESL0763]|uniref:rhamnan synthesis F family protein n=1 Tax=Bifidobacterium sp. ESL0763 TaxID=2983227 RepID=UPI0023FA4015